jgi:hypothetical protein
MLNCQNGVLFEKGQMAQSNGSIQKGRLQVFAIISGILLVALISTMTAAFAYAWVGKTWLLLLWIVPLGILCYELNAGAAWARWIVIDLLGLCGVIFGSAGLRYVIDGMGLILIGMAAICLTASWLLLRSVHVKAYLADRRAQRFPAGR